jgi:hypothetical protein
MENIYMKTSIVKLSMNECLCVNGGTGTDLPIAGNTEIHSMPAALIIPYYLKCIGIGLAAITSLITPKVAIGVYKRNVGININLLKKAVMLTADL